MTEESKWISVKDELPPVDKEWTTIHEIQTIDALITDGIGLDIGYWRASQTEQKCGWKSYSHKLDDMWTVDLLNITHWMPLPELPKPHI